MGLIWPGFLVCTLDNKIRIMHKSVAANQQCYLWSIENDVFNKGQEHEAREQISHTGSTAEADAEWTWKSRSDIELACDIVDL